MISDTSALNNVVEASDCLRVRLLAARKLRRITPDIRDAADLLEGMAEGGNCPQSARPGNNLTMNIVEAAIFVEWKGIDNWIFKGKALVCCANALPNVISFPTICRAGDRYYAWTGDCGFFEGWLRKADYRGQRTRFPQATDSVSEPRIRADATKKATFRSLTLRVESPIEERRLDKYLHAHLSDFSRCFIQEVIKQGSVRVNGKIAKKSLKLYSGDVIDMMLPRAKRRRRTHTGVTTHRPERHASDTYPTH